MWLRAHKNLVYLLTWYGSSHFALTETELKIIDEHFEILEQIGRSFGFADLNQLLFKCIYVFDQVTNVLLVPDDFEDFAAVCLLFSLQFIS